MPMLYMVKPAVEFEHSHQVNFSSDTKVNIGDILLIPNRSTSCNLVFVKVDAIKEERPAGGVWDRPRPTFYSVLCSFATDQEIQAVNEPVEKQQEAL
jgi:hypothetical protein